MVNFFVEIRNMTSNDAANLHIYSLIPIYTQEERPVVLIKVRNHFAASDSKPAERLCIYWMEKARMKLQAGAAQFCVVFDMHAFRLANMV